MRLAIILGLLGAQYSVLSTQCGAADWGQFRGPNGSAVSAEDNLPAGFSDNSGLRWKATLPGRGVSSPVVAGGRVYVTCSTGAKDDRLHVVCFDAGSGTQIWHRQIAATGGTACHPDTCMAAPTPAADATGVYALFATGDLAAFDRTGNLLWYRSLVGDYPTLSNQVGMASSPVLLNGKLIVPMDNTGESFLAAIDTKTGTNAWKAPRPKDINWVTPLVRTVGGKDEVIVSGMKELVAYDADTGAKKWAAPIAGAGIPTATLAGDTLVFPGRGLFAYALDGDKPKEVWKSLKAGGGMGSPCVYKGRVYTASGQGIVTCSDAKTGKDIWQERLKGKFSASPVAGDGKVYVVNEAGVMTVFAAADEYKLLAESDTKERGQSTPAIAGGAVFLRGDKTLFCVGSKLGG